MAAVLLFSVGRCMQVSPRAGRDPPAGERRTEPFSAAGAKVEEQQRAAAPAAQYQTQAPAAPAPEPEKAAVSDDDWDILERIFSRKR